MVSFLIKKLIGEQIPETEPKNVNFFIKKFPGRRFLRLTPKWSVFVLKKNIGEPIPEPEPRMVDFRIIRLIPAEGSLLRVYVYGKFPQRVCVYGNPRREYMYMGNPR